MKNCRSDLCRADCGPKMIASDLLLSAYQQGVFPMAMSNGEIGWFSPNPRGILPIEEFHIPRGLRRVLKKNPFEIRLNTAFREVIERCASREKTWINDTIIESYFRLYEIGRAHSVEAWQDARLVGGLYGVSLNAAFFGESMFHDVRDASKVALWALVKRLKERGYLLLDTQWTTPHLEQFGAVEIPRRQYLKLLRESQSRSCQFI
jgi:leucyl/phenylalanyl-tRNA--protein transferase